MGWEYTRYKAICKNCGHEGVCVKGDDDWMRTSTTWEGYENIEADPQAVARMKTDSRSKRARCACGSTDIEIAEIIKE